MSKTHFYITTPIYYANGMPHIGHAYTSLIADIYARMHRLLGYHVKFTTGTDENGQKMVQTAEKEGKQVMEYLDEIALGHKQTWDDLNISYTDFIRTTEQRHKEFVQNILTKTKEARTTTGEPFIYQGEYDGLYCIGCESFKKISDLTEEGLCPDHLKKPESIKEKNRFFKLSSKEGFLKDLYDKNPNFCLPQLRFNEVKSFVENGLEDFSISRQGNSFGIKFPDSIDSNATVYIWFDALYNYVTSCQGGDEIYWSDACEKIHVLGKDISRFHAIFWPAMLDVIAMPLPDREIINGYFTINGQKISKSLGNGIDPLALVKEYGRDAFVYYLFSDLKIGNDGDVNLDRLIAQKESNLKNGWSNLVNRVVSILKKVESGKFKVESNELEKVFAYIGGQTQENKLFDSLQKLDIYTIKIHYFDTANISQYLSDRYEIVGLLNAYIASTEPWKAIKTDKEGTLAQLQAVIFIIKYLGIMISPFLIDGTERLKDILQFDIPERKNFSTTEIFGDINTLETLLTFTESSLSFGEGYIYS